jgi:hypothetical protein
LTCDRRDLDDGTSMQTLIVSPPFVPPPFVPPPFVPPPAEPPQAETLAAVNAIATRGPAMAYRIRVVQILMAYSPPGDLSVAPAVNDGFRYPRRAG